MHDEHKIINTTIYLFLRTLPLDNVSNAIRVKGRITIETRGRIEFNILGKRWNAAKIDLVSILILFELLA